MLIKGGKERCREWDIGRLYTMQIYYCNEIQQRIMSGLIYRLDQCLFNGGLCVNWIGLNKLVCLN